MADFRKAFPDFPAHSLPPIPAGFVDVSSPNDACPSFLSEALGVALFCDYPDPAARESGPTSPRFALLAYGGGTLYLDGEQVFAAEEWLPMLAFLDEFELVGGAAEERTENAQALDSFKEAGMANEQALAAFLAAKSRFDSLLEALAEYSENHFEVGPDDVNWSHVGSAQYLCQRLEEAAQHAGLKTTENAK